MPSSVTNSCSLWAVCVWGGCSGRPESLLQLTGVWGCAVYDEREVDGFAGGHYAPADKVFVIQRVKSPKADGDEASTACEVAVWCARCSVMEYEVNTRAGSVGRSVAVGWLAVLPLPATPDAQFIASHVYMMRRSLSTAGPVIETTF